MPKLVLLMNIFNLMNYKGIQVGEVIYVPELYLAHIKRYVCDNERFLKMKGVLEELLVQTKELVYKGIVVFVYFPPIPHDWKLYLVSVNMD